MSKQKRRSYAEEFKQDAVRLVTEQGNASGSGFTVAHRNLTLLPVKGIRMEGRSRPFTAVEANRIMTCVIQTGSRESPKSDAEKGSATTPRNRSAACCTNVVEAISNPGCGRSRH